MNTSYNYDAEARTHARVPFEREEERFRQFLLRRFEDPPSSFSSGGTHYALEFSRIIKQISRI